MSKLSVIFDIDDVLIPILSKVHEAIGAAGLNPDNRNMTRWEMHLDYGCTKEQWVEVFSSLAVPDGIYHAAPYPGVKQAMDNLQDAGHDIHLVTARGFHNHAEQIRKWTHEWKELWDIPGTLTFAHRKGEEVSRLEADYAVDDGIHNVRDMTAAGATAYLMNRDHNLSDYWHPDYRVNSVSEFVLKVLNTDG